jgi:hypothetical protein
VLERLPAPLTVQVTPALLVSFVTIALSFTASVPSTEVAGAVTETLGVVIFVDEEPPPQPERKIAAARKMLGMKEIFEIMVTPKD